MLSYADLNSIFMPVGICTHTPSLDGIGIGICMLSVHLGEFKNSYFHLVRSKHINTAQSYS